MEILAEDLVAAAFVLLQEQREIHAEVGPSVLDTAANSNPDFLRKLVTEDI